MKWLIYPYTPKSIPIIKNKSLLKCGEVVQVSAPLGFGLEGKNGYIWGNEKSEYIIRNKIEQEIDGIWITPEIGYMSIDEILKALEKLPIANKKIYYSAYLNIDDENKIIDLCKNKGAKEIVKQVSASDIELSVSDNVLYKFDTPIVAVAGTGSFTQKFDLQLYLRKELLNLGYKVSQVGTRPYCEMFDFQSMPKWMFDSTYTDREKVYAFNHFLKMIELKEKPEVIIIGMPEGIIPFNEKHQQGFVLCAYEICSAVHPDYLIMSLYNGEYTQQFLDEMNNLTKYRLHVEIDDFYVSNYVPMSTSYKKEHMVFSYSENKKNGNMLFNIDDMKSDTWIKKLIDKLSMYSEYEVI